MRTFIALKLQKQCIDETAYVAHRLKEHMSGRFVVRENYHVTLAFLGEVSAVGISAACESIDCIAKNFDPLPIHAERLGIFGKRRNATIWIGLTPDTLLMDLAKSLRQELDRRKLTYDARSFKPHITLARHVFIPDKELSGFALPQDSFSDTICVFKSTLGNEGACYKPLHQATLRLA